MEVDELVDFVDKEIARLRQALDLHDQEKAVLAVTAKLSEELGEVSAEVLGRASLQRKEKVLGSLDEELADLIITSFVLARITGVDVKKALKAKMRKIDQRYI